jgi:formylglycine-generating enzyme required for sulfatase activity
MVAGIMCGMPSLRSLVYIAPLLVSLVATCLAQETNRPSLPGRIALIIANGAYPKAALPNALSEARALADVLRQSDFEVVLAENANRADMDKAISAFSTKLQRGGLAVVYYAGHAVQFRNRNFLVPVDADLASTNDVAVEAVDLDLILDPLIVARPTSAVVVLDASRSNPWQATLGPRARGLAGVEPIQGIAVALAASPGRVVADSGRSVSPFAAEFLKAVKVPGLDMDAALRRTKESVAKLTRGEQQVWLSAPVPAGLVVTDRPTTVANTDTRRTISPTGPQTQPDQRPKDQSEVYELAFWESIRSSENAAEYRAYLEAYPQGRFAALARAREQTLISRQAMQDIKPTPPDASRGNQPLPATLRDCDRCPELVLIPAGTFDMGSDEVFEFEKPVHQVTIRKPFYIGKREVTFEEWDACADEGGCGYRPSDRGRGRGKRPVTDIDWKDATGYLVWLSSKTGHSYRLPTEAEWEYAARAGTTTSFPWGRTVDKNRANCLGCNPEPLKQTVETGSFPPNAFGLFDMAGNAAEWVEDCWSDNYKGAPTDGTAFTKPGCRERVLRGGSFNNDSRYLRSAARFKYDYDVRFYTNGFRVARDP